MSAAASASSGPVLVNLTHLSPHMAGILRTSAGVLRGLLALDDGPSIEVVTTQIGLQALAAVGLELPSTMVTLVPAAFSRSKPLAAIAALTLLPLIARRRGASTILNLDYYFSPGIGRTRSISMVTDVQFLDRPESFSASARWSRALFLRLAARFCDAVIGISQTSSDRFIDAFPAAGDKTVVVHLGIEASTEVAPFQDWAGELLFVGTTNAHKNLRVVIEAFELGLAQELQLVVAGRPGSFEPELCKAVANPSFGNRIERVGRIEDSALWELYGQSDVLIAPSVYEGFDLPTLEAMAAGTHVVASDLPVHREILQDHAEYFEPNDPEGLAAAIQSARNRTDDQRDRAIAHARGFSWDRSAETLAALL